jgi:O-antigen/teichoic acid export membrane protein
MEKKNKIVKNSFFLYIKLIVNFGISFYSLRIVLDALGTEDFGLFSLISGVIALFSFLNGSMTVTTQRYLSFNLGKGILEINKKVFQNSIILHLILGILIVLLLESLGFFMFNNFLKIEESRIETAKVIYQFMIVSAFFTINSVPYDSAINANEDMHFDSIIGILESILKLVIAFTLTYTKTYDKLIVYGLLMALLTIVVRIVKSIWCYQKYDECELKLKKVDIGLLKEMISFAGWNLFGAMSYLARNQGIAFILNFFYGTKMNASYGVTNQLNSSLMSFSSIIAKAFNPQISKSEGSGDRTRMIYLSILSSKITSLLLILLLIPIILELNFILNLWLVNVPEYTYIFCVLVLINSLINQMSIGLKNAIQATGNIRNYTVVVALTIMLIIPISYFLLKIGYPPYSIFIVTFMIEILSLGLRLYFVKKVIDFSILFFLKEVVVKVLSISVVSFLILLLLKNLFQESLLRLITLSIANVIICSILIWFFALLKSEKLMISSMFLKFKNKIIKSQ